MRNSYYVPKKPLMQCPHCEQEFTANNSGIIRKHACVPSTPITAFIKRSEARPLRGRHQEIVNAFLDAPDDAKPTLQQLGDQFGVTRERIRQILDGQGIRTRPYRKNITEAKKLAALTVKFQKAIADALTRPPCPICGAWVVRGEYRTCSHECAEAWTRGRFIVDAEQHQLHRIRQAQTYLKSPEKYNSSHVEWAKRMLSDNPPPPNRRFAYRNKDLFDRVREAQSHDR